MLCLLARSRSKYCPISMHYYLFTLRSSTRRSFLIVVAQRGVQFIRDRHHALTWQETDILSLSLIAPTFIVREAIMVNYWYSTHQQLSVKLNAYGETGNLDIFVACNGIRNLLCGCITCCVHFERPLYIRPDMFNLTIEEMLFSTFIHVSICNTRIAVNIFLMSVVLININRSDLKRRQLMHFCKQQNIQKEKQWISLLNMKW